MKKTITLIMSSILITLLYSCGTTKQSMICGENVPAAEGIVSVKEVDNDNKSMTFTVKHLAAAKKVFTGSTNYIVWIKPEGINSDWAYCL